MKKGFTLAEVLITLAIIGVVAALTIPTLVGKYKKHELYTQFMKAYNTMSTALSLAVAEHGDADMWTLDYDNIEAGIQKYFLPYVGNYTKGNKNDYLTAIGGDAKRFNGENAGAQAVVHDPYIFSDGSYVTYMDPEADNEPYIRFVVDVNGTKGPNTMGRDIFQMSYGYNKYMEKSFVFSYVELYDPEENNTYDTLCNPNGGTHGNYGITCTEKLLAEGKMNY